MRLKDSAHILIVPDSYKGNLSSKRVAEIIAASFRSNFPTAQIEAYPMADGGESSSEIVGELLGAQRREIEVCGPEATTVSGFYYLTPDHRAFIELAAASGFALSRAPKQTAGSATTYGCGQLIAHAVNDGAKEIYFFLGGSATTDGGVGLAKALGWRFYDISGSLLPEPCTRASRTSQDRDDYPGEQLSKIANIEPGSSIELLRGIKVIGVSDVKNPLFGPTGAAYTYGPQKGADSHTVAELDAGLRNLAKVYSSCFDRTVHDRPGAGAAGGAGFGVIAFLGGELRDGPSFFLELIEFDRKLPTLDLIITGEGKVDSQSMRGKLLNELLARAQTFGVPVISFAGVSDLRIEDLQSYPNFSAFGLGHTACLTEPEPTLELLSYQLARLLRA